MIRRRALPGVLVALWIGTTGAVADSPPSITDLAARTSLDQTDKSRIQKFAEYWGGQLAGEDSTEVVKARGELVKPLRAIDVRAPFRFAFSDAALPQLQSIIAADSPQGTQNAINALQVAGFMGTVKAMDAILAHCDLDREKRFEVRLWAAKAFAMTVGPATLVPANDISRGLRELGRAATHEDQWLVLRRQFEAIASVRTDVSRDVQIQVLDATAKRMALADGPSPLMQAIYAAVKLMRDQFIDLDAPKQESMGAVLGPVLGQVQEVAARHWDQAQSNPQARDIYGSAIKVSEILLAHIDRVARPKGPPPRLQLDLNWRQGDEARFQQDLNLLKSLLSQPPYRAP